MIQPMLSVSITVPGTLGQYLVSCNHYARINIKGVTTMQHKYLYYMHTVATSTDEANLLVLSTIAGLVLWKKRVNAI